MTGPEVSPVRRSTLLFALTSGIVAWMVHLVGASVLVPAACEASAGWTIDLLTAATAMVCLAGIAVGIRVRRRAGDGADPRAEGYRLVGYVAVASNAISLALVVGEGAMHLWVSACR